MRFRVAAMASGLPSPNLLISDKLVLQVYMYHGRISEMLARREVNLSTCRLRITLKVEAARALDCAFPAAS